jgi:hypothetical protein
MMSPQPASKRIVIRASSLMLESCILVVRRSREAAMRSAWVPEARLNLQPMNPSSLVPGHDQAKSTLEPFLCDLYI